MHELSIVQGIMDTILAQQDQHQFKVVHRIDVHCGAYHSVNEDSLNFYLRAISAGTCLEAATICLTRFAESRRCPKCDHTFFVSEAGVAGCPHCGGEETIIQFNHGLFVTNLEVD